MIFFFFFDFQRVCKTVKCQGKVRANQGILRWMISDNPDNATVVTLLVPNGAAMHCLKFIYL